MKLVKYKDYDLSNEIKRGLSELGFKYPMEVQQKVLPMVLEGKDLIVQSQTGSGKTAAFGIPIAEKIDVEIVAPQALIIAPTRELAVQVKEDIANIAKYKDLKCCAIYGKEPIEIQRKKLKAGQHIIAATPGRLLDHMRRKRIKLDNLKYLVIDEADELLNMGFKEELESIISKLPEDRTTLLFSATMPDTIEEMCSQHMNNPERIEIEPEVTSLEKIKQIYYEVDEHKKIDFLKKMIAHERPNRCIIFFNTRSMVEKLNEVMKKWNYTIATLHGGMEQNDRMKTIAKFKNGEIRFLLATDVAARGIHVANLSHVINYNVPFEDENYVHRIGRTGRVDQEGIAISLISAREFRRLDELEEFLGYRIPRMGGRSRAPKEERVERVKKNQRYKRENTRRTKARIQLNVGRNTGIRAGDILGTIRSIRGLTQQDVGTIEIQPDKTYIEIFEGKEAAVMKALRSKKIKGRDVRVKKA